jgi:capsular polysaccharide biosynthesis protein
MKEVGLDEYIAINNAVFVVPQKVDYEERNLNDVNHSNLSDPKLKVVELQDVYVTSDGFVFDKDYFITDLGYADRISKNISIVEGLGEVTNEVDKASLVGGHANYYHWLINWLPRLFLLEICGFDKGTILVGESWAGFQNAAFNYMVREADYQVLNVKEVIFVKRLRVPVFFSNPLHAPFAVSQLRSRAENDMIFIEPQKVYISRRSAKGRRVVNEDELFSVLSKKGYELFELESLSFKEQIRLFSNATHLVAPHGAGLVNVIFSRKLKFVVEIFNNSWSRVFWSLGAMVGVKRYAAYNALPVNNGLKSQLHDLKIDIADFLEKFEGEL